jgi:transposase
MFEEDREERNYASMTCDDCGKGLILPGWLCIDCGKDRGLI